MKAPCKGCGARHAYCHGKCERYLAFKERLAEAAKEREKDNAATPVLCRKVVLQIWREMKRR